MKSALSDKSPIQTSLMAQLSHSVDELYRVFATYPLKETIWGCPHCVGERDKNLLYRAPLDRLTEVDLGRYAFKAMTTWGDSKDFRHFLPRIIELSMMDTSYLGLDPWIIGSKLAYAQWEKWPVLEREALSNFMEIAWRVLLSHPPDTFSMETSGPIKWPIEDALAFLANARNDLGSYLDIWAGGYEVTFYLHLAVLATDQAPIFAKKKRLQIPVFESENALDQLKNWLLIPTQLVSLQKVFEREIEGEWSDILAQGVDALEWMIQVEGRS